MEIKKTNVKDIYSVIQQDRNAIWGKLKQVLGDDMPFAEFKIGAGFYTWEATSDDWIPFTRANSLVQEEIREAYYHLQEEISAKVGTKTAEALFTIPGQEYIFYKEMGDNIRLLLTGWCFKKPVSRNGKEIFIIEEPNPIDVCFTRGGTPQPYFKFRVQYDNRIRTLTTGNDGFFHFSNIKVGEVYTLCATDSENEQFELRIVEGKKQYEFALPFELIQVTPVEPEPPVIEDPTEQEEPIVPVTATIKVTVLDYLGKPLKCNSITLSQEGIEKKILQLDAEGKVFLPENAFAYHTPIHVNIEGNERPCDPFVFSTEANEYEYVLQETEPAAPYPLWKLILGILAILAIFLIPVLLWDQLNDIKFDRMFD